MVHYYDKIIVGIAGSLATGVLVGLLTTVALETGIVVGSIVATLFMYDAMIRNPPLPPTDPHVAAPMIVWHAVLFLLAVDVWC